MFLAVLETIYLSFRATQNETTCIPDRSLHTGGQVDRSVYGDRSGYSHFQMSAVFLFYTLQVIELFIVNLVILLFISKLSDANSDFL